MSVSSWYSASSLMTGEVVRAAGYSDSVGCMDYRTLGNSGCAVSAYGLGTMTFGTEADEATSHALLDQFVEAGGTFVDTADVYSAGTSEEIIGRWFADRPADVTEPVVLAT